MLDVLPKVDDLGLKILYLLLPGIICFFIVKSVGPKHPRTDFESGIQIFLYGVASYAVAGLIEGVVAWVLWIPPRPEFLSMVLSRVVGLGTLNAKGGLGSGQIAFATSVAAILGLMLSWLRTHSLPHRVLHSLKMTKRTSEVDMWSFVFNSNDIDSWVNVRHENGRVYQGWVRGYSDGEDVRELILMDVIVYAEPEKSSSELIEVDRVPVLYLGLDKCSTVIELRTE